MQSKPQALPMPKQPHPSQTAAAGGMVTEGIGSVVLFGLAIYGGYMVYKMAKKKG